MRIFVTGANGFVGRVLCATMRDNGHDVIEGSRALYGDIGPNTQWKQHLEGMDAIIHLAARVHVMDDKAADPLAAFRHVNTLGAATLAEAAAAAGVKRMVFASTIKVNGEATPADRPFKVSDEPKPRDPYAISKAEAERALFAISNRTGLEVAVIRPPLVYGPDVGGNFARLIGIAAKKWWLPFQDIANKRSLIYVENLAQALMLAATHPQGAGKTWLVRDGLDLSTGQLITALRKAMGQPARLFSFSPKLLSQGLHMLGRGALAQRLLGSLTVDDQPIRQKLGYAPKVSTDKALKTTVEIWLKNQP